MVYYVFPFSFWTAHQRLPQIRVATNTRVIIDRATTFTKIKIKCIFPTLELITFSVDLESKNFWKISFSILFRNYINFWGHNRQRTPNSKERKHRKRKLRKGKIKKIGKCLSWSEPSKLDDERRSGLWVLWVFSLIKSSRFHWLTGTRGFQPVQGIAMMIVCAF